MRTTETTLAFEGPKLDGRSPYMSAYTTAETLSVPEAIESASKTRRVVRLFSQTAPKIRTNAAQRGASTVQGKQ